MTAEAQQGLGSEWLHRAQQKIDEAPAGEYTLKQLFTRSWPGGSEGQAIGLRFKHDVKDGNLKRIEYARDTGAHAAVYRIF